MSDININGLKFYAVLRCSETDQIKTSLPQQRAAIQSYAIERNLTIYKIDELGGFSATLGEQVEPLLKIIKLKLGGADFDGILFDSYNRFVRSDVDGARLYAEAADAGLLIVTVKEGLMMGEGSWVKRGSATDQSVGYTRDQSRNLNRAIADLVETKRITPTTRFVWGLDRLYYNAEDQEMFRVRKLQDGQFEVMDPQPPFKHRYFLQKARRLHLRQHGWRFCFVPGDPASVDALREMFTLFYKEKWGLGRITLHLNARGIKSPGGCDRWSRMTVANVLENPVYIGIDVGCVMGCGSHTERRKGSPNVLPIPRRPEQRKDGKGRRKTLRTILRDPSQWQVSEQTHLCQMLPPEIRELALVEWERKKQGGWSKKPAPILKYANKSIYFLSRILKIKKDGCEMLGSSGGRRNSKDGSRAEPNRYYRTYRDEHCPKPGEPKERLNAVAIESPVLTAMQLVLSDIGPSKPTIIKAIREEQTMLAKVRQHVEPLRQEKTRLESQYKKIIRIATSQRGKELLASDIAQIEARLDQIDRELASAAIPVDQQGTTEEIVESLSRQFTTLTGFFDPTAFVTLRRLAETFISRLTFDADTREVEMELALPTWSLSKRDTIVERMKNGTEERLACQSFPCTTRRKMIPLLSVRGKSNRASRREQFKLTYFPAGGSGASEDEPICKGRSRAQIVITRRKESRWTASKSPNGREKSFDSRSAPSARGHLPRTMCVRRAIGGKMEGCLISMKWNARSATTRQCQSSTLSHVTQPNLRRTSLRWNRAKWPCPPAGPKELFQAYCQIVRKGR